MRLPLDTYTLLIAGMAEVIILAILMGAISIWRRHQAGVAEWAIGNVFIAVGLLLLGLRGQIPLFISAVFGNSILVGAAVSIFVGTCKFLGRHHSTGVNVFLLTAIVMLEIYYTVVVDDLNMRSFAFAFILCLAATRIAVLLFSQAPRSFRGSAIFTGVFFTAMAAVMAFRAAYVLYEWPLTDLFQNNLVQTMVFVSIILASTGWNFGFFMMSSEKLESSLREAQDELQRLSITDHLTGVYNRRHFYELGRHEFETARRYRKPLSIIFIDTDLFKSINDRHGHMTGDAVLARLANEIQTNLRKADMLGRFGGEEFAILLPMTSLQAAQQTAERLRILVASIRLAEIPDLTLTVSMGVTSLEESDQALEDLVRRADNAMYVAKNNGRNRVEVTGTVA